MRSLEVELMTEQQIPWQHMAFPTVTEALKLYFSDRKKNRYPVRMFDIVRDGDSPGHYQVKRIS